ncbi:MAG: hypothetical protein EBT51_12065, partial [Flavobacteriaceae bacterium]|nr:hypothetical protein [Flavobacteriaceae bacterium]
MNNPATQNITILHDTQEWSTDLDGEIGEIRVDGKRLSDIHDLTTKIDRMTTIIKALALTATLLAVIGVAGVSGIGSWLVAHHDQISATLDASQAELNRLTN